MHNTNTSLASRVFSIHCSQHLPLLAVLGNIETLIRGSHGDRLFWSDSDGHTNPEPHQSVYEDRHPIPLSNVKSGDGKEESGLPGSPEIPGGRKVSGFQEKISAVQDQGGGSSPADPRESDSKFR